jgi:hypothetical protein
MVLKRMAAWTREMMVLMETEPKDMPPPYQGTASLIWGRPSPRRLISTSREMSSWLNWKSGRALGNRKRSLSKPPPESPRR